MRRSNSGPHTCVTNSSYTKLSPQSKVTFLSQCLLFLKLNHIWLFLFFSSLLSLYVCVWVFTCVCMCVQCWILDLWIRTSKYPHTSTLPLSPTQPCFLLSYIGYINVLPTVRTVFTLSMWYFCLSCVMWKLHSVSPLCSFQGSDCSFHSFISSTKDFPKERRLLCP